MRKISVLILILFSSLSSAGQIDCPSLLEVIGSDGVAALQRAESRKGEYQVSVLTREFDGNQKYVVLLGEWHKKSAKDKAIGREVIKHFPLRGLEGADSSKLWGGRVFSWAIDVSHKSVQFLWLGKRKQDSTITDAASDETIQYAIDLALDKIEEMVKAGKISEQDLQNFVIKINDQTTIDVSDAMAKHRANQFNSDKSKIINVPLEKGHKPGLPEQMASLTLPATVFACVGSICGLVLDHAIPENSVSMVLRPVSDSILWFVTFQTIGAKLFKSWRGHWLYEHSFPAARGLLDGRDKTMTANIVEALEIHKHEDALLALVGQGHVEGIERYLIQKYGFQKTEIPAQLKEREPESMN